MYTCSVVICIQHPTSCSSNVFLWLLGVYFCVCVLFSFPLPSAPHPARCSVPARRWTATLAFTEVRTRWRKHAAQSLALSRNLVRRADTAPSRAHPPTAQQAARPTQQQFFLARSVASKCDCLQYGITFACLDSRSAVLWTSLVFCSDCLGKSFPPRWYVLLPKLCICKSCTEFCMPPAAFTPIFHLPAGFFVSDIPASCFITDLDVTVGNFFCAWVCPSQCGNPSLFPCCARWLRNW